MNQFHRHTASYAPPAAPAPGTVNQSGLILEADAKPQRPLTGIVTAKSYHDFNQTATVPSTAVHTGKVLSPAAAQRAQSYRKIRGH